MNPLELLRQLAAGNASALKALTGGSDSLRAKLREMVRQKACAESFQESFDLVSQAERVLPRIIAQEYSVADPERLIRNMKALIAAAAATIHNGEWATVTEGLLGSATASNYWMGTLGVDPPFAVRNRVTVQAAFVSPMSNGLVDFIVEVLEGGDSICFEHPGCALFPLGKELLETIHRWRAHDLSTVWFLRPHRYSDRDRLLNGDSLAAPVGACFQLAALQRQPRRGRILVAGLEPDSAKLIHVGGERLKLEAAQLNGITQAGVAPTVGLTEWDRKQLHQSGLRTEVLQNLEEAVRWLAPISWHDGACPLHDAFFIPPVNFNPLQLLENADKTVNVRGPHGSGKSSVVERIVEAARVMQITPIVFECGRLLMDLQACKGKPSLLQTVAKRLNKELSGPPLDWNGNDDEGDQLSVYLEECLSREPRRVLLVFDSCHELLGDPRSAELFATIRKWHNARANSDIWYQDLWLVLSTTSEPMLFDLPVSQSPFNIGARIILDGFGAQDCVELAFAHGIPANALDLEDLLKLTGGLPNLVRRTLFEWSFTPHAAWANIRDRVFACNGVFRGYLEDRRNFLMQNSTDLKPTMLAALGTGLKLADSVSAARAAVRLEQEGFLRRVGAEYKVRAKLYQDCLF